MYSEMDLEMDSEMDSEMYSEIVRNGFRIQNCACKLCMSGCGVVSNGKHAMRDVAGKCSAKIFLGLKMFRGNIFGTGKCSAK